MRKFIFTKSMKILIVSLLLLAAFFQKERSQKLMAIALILWAAVTVGILLLRHSGKLFKKIRILYSALKQKIGQMMETPEETPSPVPVREHPREPVPPTKPAFPASDSREYETMLVHISLRITEKLKSAYPQAVWQWKDTPDLQDILKDGTIRILVENMDTYTHADISFDRFGRIHVEPMVIGSFADAENGKGGIPAPGGTGKPVAGSAAKQKVSHDPSSDDEDRKQLQQVLDYEDGRIELEKTDEIGEDGDGGTSRTNDYAGAGYVSQAAADMEHLMTQLAEEAAYASYEEELSEELQAESDKIRYGNAHRGMHININRMAYVDPSYMEAYQKVAPPLLLISKRLQKQISQLLKDYREGGKLDNLPMGKRINVRNAVRNDGRLFYKLKLPNDRTDIAVVILNDESGSMSSCNRITYARSASIILHDFCKGLDIPVAIYGHSEFDDVELYAYAEFDSIDNKDQYRLMDMSARCGNRDGAALRYAAERLMTRPEAIKLLIIISDGQPAGEDYYGTEAEADLRGIKKEYTAKGIQLFAAAIGSDKPNIQRIYGDGFLDITNLEKLPVNLGRLIIQQIKNKYAA